ncbi:MAG: preprotein translocase subunit SecE [Candidatus Nanopelagicales bacterium]
MSESRTQAAQQGGSKKAEHKLGLFAQIALFLRQMVAELRKVIWPTRKELITYTTVVMVFVGLVTALVAVLDFVFTKLVLTVFG